MQHGMDVIFFEGWVGGRGTKSQSPEEREEEISKRRKEQYHRAVIFRFELRSPIAMWILAFLL